MKAAIIAIIVTLLAIAGAVALLQGPNDQETYTTEAYVMAVGENSITICEQERPLNRNLVKAYDIDGNHVDLRSLPVPFQAVMTMGYVKDEPVIKEIRVQIQYRIEEGSVVEERRSDVL